MQVSYVKILACHNDPGSCLDDPQGRGEALTEESAGWALSRERYRRGADVVRRCGGPHRAGRYGEPCTKDKGLFHVRSSLFHHPYPFMVPSVFKVHISFSFHPEKLFLIPAGSGCLSGGKPCAGFQAEAGYPPSSTTSINSFAVTFTSPFPR